MLLVEPARLQGGRGNTVTVARWKRGLEAAGCGVSLANAEADLAARASDADLVHAHHAVRTGPAAAACSRAFGLPLVVSLGGTDLHGKDGRPRSSGLDVLRQARLIAGPFQADAARLGDAMLARRFRRVRRAVPLPELVPEPRPAGPPRLLCVGALRPVKGQRAAVRLLDALRARGVPAGLTIMGPDSDPATRTALEEARRDRPWLIIAEPRPHAAIGGAYEAADVLLNTSRAEGASNAILEAWAHGLRVLASDVPGNRDLLQPAPAECARLLEPEGEPSDATLAWLLEQNDAGEAESSAALLARNWVRTAHDPADEIRELLDVYREAVSPA